MALLLALPASLVIAYALPAAGVCFGFLLMTLYVVKYATDVLLIAPGVVGILFGLTRIWDALFDPLAGHLSDRTLSRMGRRRSWMLFSALPDTGLPHDGADVAAVLARLAARSGTATP